jgi:MmyB-like transcription regulator ligand binding domain
MSRDINVSAQALNTIARALHMDGTERTHLFMLARQPLPAQPPPDEETTPVLRRVLANVDLQQISPEFARWWPRHDVRERPGGRKEFRHPTAGVLVLEDSLFQTFSSGGCTRPADIFLYPLDEADTPAKLQKLVAGRPCISPTDQQPPRKQSAR